MITVTMHFGDGTFKEIESDSDNPLAAVKEIRAWVYDNAWFEVLDEDGHLVSKAHLFQYPSR